MPPKKAFCRICNDYRQFTRCWLRVDRFERCPDCGFEFPDVDFIYGRHQPVCPQCEEYLEQPDFEYGFCDVCGSKFEIMGPSRPTLLPNRQQRAEMNKHGRVRRPD